MNKKKGYLSILSDSSFSNFITPEIIGGLYIFCSLIISSIVFVVVVVSLVTAFDNPIESIFAIVASLFTGLSCLLLTRVSLEALIAGIITARNTTEMKEYIRQIRNENVNNI